MMISTYLNKDNPRLSRAFWLTFCVGTSCLLGASTLCAGELRFNTVGGDAEIETRRIEYPDSRPNDELVDLLDNALDHRQRKVAEERLADSQTEQDDDFESFTPVYTAQRPSSGYLGSSSVSTQPRPSDLPSRFVPASTVLDPGSAQKTPAKVAPAYSNSISSLDPRNAVDVSETIFNSSAYANDPNAGRPEFEQLAVDDVREFSQQSATEAESADNAFLEELSEDVAAEEKLASVTFAEVADECFYALDPYSSLFIEYAPTNAWTEAVLQYVEDSIYALESPDNSTADLLKRFEAKVAEADDLKTKLSEAAQLDPGSQNVLEPGKTPVLVERYTLQQRVDMLTEFKNSLMRRVRLWTASLPYFQARRLGVLKSPSDLSTSQLIKALRETSDVRAFFGDTPNGRSWRASFDVDLLADDIAAVLEMQLDFTPVDGAQHDLSADEGAPDAVADKTPTKRDLLLKERARRMSFLRDRLNSIAYKLEKTPMTPEQRLVFKRPALASWSKLARDFSCDQTSGAALLYEFERYENIGGGQSGRSLQQLALRMSTSKSSCSRDFGRAVDTIYDNPNVKAYVSEALINRMIPIRDPEFGVVQERILNNPVAGKRRVDTTVKIDLVPDPNRLLMNLVVNGRVSSITSSEVFTTKLHNESYATYIGRKMLEWRDTGIAYSAASVSANSANKLSSVETDIDFVPLVGDVARGMVRAQYESRQGEIQAQMRARVVAEASQRIDEEANERFDMLNAKLRNGFFTRLNNLDLALKMQRSRTTADWLLASMRLGSDYSLGCQTAEPPTLDGAFADVKLHESALNAYIAQLDLGGRESDPRETLEYLAQKLDRPGLRNIELEDNDLHYTFAKTDPIVVRFFEDQIRLRLHFSKMRLGAQEWEDLEVVVNYRPSIGPDGQPTFTRDGVVQLYGPTDIKSLFPLRAIFAKVFAAQKTFDLKPEALTDDDRFFGLCLGFCRVKPGWFAVSVVRDDSAYENWRE